MPSCRSSPASLASRRAPALPTAWTQAPSQGGGGDEEDLGEGGNGGAEGGREEEEEGRLPAAALRPQEDEAWPDLWAKQHKLDESPARAWGTVRLGWAGVGDEGDVEAAKRGRELNLSRDEGWGGKEKGRSVTWERQKGSRFSMAELAGGTEWRVRSAPFKGGGTAAGASMRPAHNFPPAQPLAP